MRSARIPVLLLSTYVCTAPAHLAAGHRTASLRENPRRIAAHNRQLRSVVSICLIIDSTRRMTDTDKLIIDEAETRSSVMFASIRITLEWHQPPACAGDPVFVIMKTNVPHAYLPGALGLALPLEGSHAWVFYDRVRNSAQDDGISPLLAHVFSHEIAHVLQGTIRHSESGILEAHWGQEVCARMASFPLMFTPTDAFLIHRGLEERRSRLASNPVAQMPANGSIGISERPATALP